MVEVMDRIMKSEIEDMANQLWEDNRSNILPLFDVLVGSMPPASHKHLLNLAKVLYKEGVRDTLTTMINEDEK
jgi:hypothetical protein